MLLAYYLLYPLPLFSFLILNFAFFISLLIFLFFFLLVAQMLAYSVHDLISLRTRWTPNCTNVSPCEVAKIISCVIYPLPHVLVSATHKQTLQSTNSLTLLCSQLSVLIQQFWIKFILICHDDWPGHLHVSIELVCLRDISAVSHSVQVWWLLDHDSFQLRVRMNRGSTL